MGSWLTMTKPSPLQPYVRKLKTWLIQNIWGFNAADVTKALSELGVRQGDIIMVHSSFGGSTSYKGTIPQLIDAFINAVGATGTVAMQSMAYYGMRSADYLDSGKPFDVRRSISKMGIISEVFRRRPDVRRSLHPTHPITYWGARGEWLVEHQIQDLAPFGENSPFARLLEAGGKVVMFDAGIDSMTFVCHLEHLFQNTMPVPLYDPSPKIGTVIDYEGQEHQIKTLVLSEQSSRVRNLKRLESDLMKSGSIKEKFVGRTRLLVGDAQGMRITTENLVGNLGGFHNRAS